MRLQDGHKPSPKRCPDRFVSERDPHIGFGSGPKTDMETRYGVRGPGSVFKEFIDGKRETGTY